MLWISRLLESEVKGTMKTSLSKSGNNCCYMWPLIIFVFSISILQQVIKTTTAIFFLKSTVCNAGLERSSWQSTKTRNRLVVKSCGVSM